MKIFNKKSKPKYFFILLFIIFLLYGIYYIFDVPNWFLIEKTNFKNYESFRNKTSSFYPSSIPNEETNDIEYYYLKGHYNDISATSFIIDEVTYNELKEKYDTDSFFCHDDSKYNYVARYQPLTKEILNKDELKYIRRFISNENEYEILHLAISNAVFQNKGYNYSGGVFYNKNEHRIIIFRFTEGVNLWGNIFSR